MIVAPGLPARDGASSVQVIDIFAHEGQQFGRLYKSARGIATRQIHGDHGFVGEALFPVLATAEIEVREIRAEADRVVGDFTQCTPKNAFSYLAEAPRTSQKQRLM